MAQTYKQLRDCCSPELFRALADPNRIALLARLLDGGAADKTVTGLARCCPVDLSVVSRHLRQLRDAGVVEAEKRGKQVFYRVRARELAAMLRRLADALDSCCPTDAAPAQGGRSP